MPSLLEVSDLRTGYGQVPVLHGVDLAVQEGETAVLLGLNGAGKTTTLLTIAGLLRRWAGDVVYDGRRLRHEDARALVRRGIVLIPEGRRVFPALSVQNNLRLGAWPHRRDHRLFRKNLDRVFGIFPVLKERRGQLAGTLSGGEQQMLALGRGLMASPRLLLIDEASLGLSPKLAQSVFDTVARINGEGVTVLIVEQNVGVLAIANHAYVMQKGRIEFQGSGEELLEQGELRRAYLGAPA
ncbi:MAG TPA: ABC transporter ATP-binding protein [Actinomycetota bacterium]|nr:ABC transporter ATP-binding protein [Actinomycetota bacterium]